MKKQLLSMLLGLTLVFSLTACGGSASSAAPSGDGGNGSADLKPITAGMFEGPILITSVGQSADAKIVETLFKKAELETSLQNTIAADALGDTYKTLVLAIGGSSKGLGAAGIDENQELARVTALIAAAKDKGVKVLAVHIGGAARRGTLSDKFIPDSIKSADAAIIVSEGDTDNLMRDLLVAGGIPAEYIESQTDSIAPIKTVFTK